MNPARLFTVAGFIARVPMSMVGLSIILLVQNRTGSYALGASVAATASLFGASVAPLLSKAADRLGQARLLRISCGAQTVAMLGLLSSISDHVTPGAYVCAALLGGCTASIGSFVRARWSASLREKSLLQTAFAWESILDEGIFIVGPVIATFASAKIHDTAPFAVALACLLIGCMWLAGQHGTEPIHTREHAPAHSSPGSKGGWPVATPGIAGVVLGAVFLGAMFSAADISTVAFAIEKGQRALSGVMLGLWAGGSLIGGIIYGSRPSSSRLNITYARAAGLLAASLLPLPLVATLAPAPLISTALMMLVSGLCVAPTLTSAFALVDRMSERSRVTESLAWTMSGIGIGIAAMSTIIGIVIDRYAATRGFWLVAGLSVLHAAASASNLPASTRRLRKMADTYANNSTTSTEPA